VTRMDVELGGVHVWVPRFRRRTYLMVIRFADRQARIGFGRAIANNTPLTPRYSETRDAEAISYANIAPTRVKTIHAKSSWVKSVPAAACPIYLSNGHRSTVE
jgi:hypothetical protein